MDEYDAKALPSEIPSVLSTLTLVERLLITQRFPAAYHITLLCDTPVRPVKYNVDLRILDGPHPNGLFCAELPLSSACLEKIINLRVIGAFRIQKSDLPDCLRVRSSKVRDALNWLSVNNPLYAQVSICEQHLHALPANGVPFHIVRDLHTSTQTFVRPTVRVHCLLHSGVAFDERHISEMFPCLFPFAANPFKSLREDDLRCAAIHCFAHDKRFAMDRAFAFVIFKYIIADRYKNLPFDWCPVSTGFEVGPIVHATVSIIDRLTGVDFLKSNLRGELRGCVALLGRPAAWASMTESIEMFPGNEKIAPFEATADFEKNCHAFISTILGWDISNGKERPGTFLGDVTAFITSVSTESTGKQTLDVLLWFDGDSLDSLHNGNKYALVRRALDEHYDIHVTPLAINDANILPFMTKSLRSPHVLTDRASELLTAYTVPCNDNVQRVVQHSTSSVVFDGELSQTEMMRIILDVPNTHCSHTFVSLNWEKLVGAVKDYFRLRGPARLINCEDASLEAYKSRKAEWANLSLWQFTLRRYPGASPLVLRIPRVTGQWTPLRSQERPLYWASMLALWKPWRNLSELRQSDQGFHDEFDSFLTTRDDATQREWSTFQSMLHLRF